LRGLMVMVFGWGGVLVLLVPYIGPGVLRGWPQGRIAAVAR
jgi:hypothetical protein